MITVSAPGKLYIAGEYAIVAPGNAAVLVAVNRYIKIKAALTTGASEIESDQTKAVTVVMHRDPSGQLVAAGSTAGFEYVVAAIHTAEAYLAPHPLLNYRLSISSDLDSKDGSKFGLGSSAAVTVATIKAICTLNDRTLDSMTLFKLAAIAHWTVQGNGSLGDVACSVYQGWIAYQSFDRNWLAAHLQTASVQELVAADWPELSIQRLCPPKDLRLLIGWTGSPASTSNLVKRVTAQKIDQQFLAASRDCVDRLIAGFKQQSLPIIQAQIDQNRRLLAGLAKATGVTIETPVLKQMCTIADRFGGVAKTSGAGGGDCGIVIINRDVDITPIIAQWRQSRIQKLDLQIADYQEAVHD